MIFLKGGIMQSVQFEDKYRIAVNESQSSFTEDVKKGSAILFYLEETMTLGQAAELAEMSHYDFMIYLGKLGIPVLETKGDKIIRTYPDGREEFVKNVPPSVKVNKKLKI